MKTKSLILSYLLLVYFALAFSLDLKAQNEDFNKAKRAFKSGNYAEAATNFEKALPAVKKQEGENEKYQEIVLFTAVSYERSKKNAKAIEYYKKVLALGENLKNKTSQNYDIAAGNLANLYRKSSEFEKAAEIYSGLLKVLAENKKIETKEFAATCNRLAGIYKHQKKYKESLKLYMEAIKIREKVLGESHELYAESYMDMAMLMLKIGTFSNNPEEKEEVFNHAEKNFGKSISLDVKYRGKSHLYYLMGLDSLAVLYKEWGKDDKLEKLYIEILETIKTYHGKNHEGYKGTIDKLLDIYKKNNELRKQIPLYTELKATLDSLKGKNNINYLATCNSLGLCYSNICKAPKSLAEKNEAAQKSEALFMEAKQLLEKYASKETPQYASYCYNLGSLYVTMGKYSQAEEQFKEALKIDKKLYGKKHATYASDCNNLGTLYSTIGKYKKALPLFEEALEIYKNLDNNFEYANLCNNLGSLYYKMGNYNRAKNLLIEAKRLNEKYYGKSHEKYSTSCGNLGLTYSHLGNLQKAEKLLIEALTIDSKIHGKDHSSYAKGCNNLGSVYEKMGQNIKALDLYIEAASILEKLHGKKSTEYTTCLNNIALIYGKIKLWEKQEEKLIEVKSLNEQIFGTAHSTYGLSCNNLGELYVRLKKYDKAEDLLTKALKSDEKTLGKDHPTYANTCSNLALLYFNQGKLKKAEALYLETQKIYEKSFGKEHILYAKVCDNLGLLYDQKEDFEKAEKQFKTANQIRTSLLQKTAKYMSELEREKYFTKEIDKNLAVYYSFFLERSKNKSINTSLVYNNALLTKGNLLRSSIAIRKAILNSNDNALIDMYNTMNDYGKIIAREHSLSSNKRSKEYFQIKHKVDSLEKKIASAGSKLPVLKQLSDNPDWKKVEQALNDDEAAIEFISFRYRDNKKWTYNTLYYALVIRKGYDAPKAFRLFEEKQLSKLLIRTETETDYEYVKRLYDYNSPESKTLKDIAFKPFEQIIEGCNTLYLSPSGLLNKIAFDAIIYDDKTILSDKFKIHYVSSSSQIGDSHLLMAKDLKSIALFGGIEYNLSIEEMEKLAKKINKDKKVINEESESPEIDSTARNVSWNYLAGSLKEAQNIKDVIQTKNIEVNFYSDKEGSEEQFKNLEYKAPSVIHVSTHGFYFGDDEKSEMYKDMIDKDVEFAHSYNPLLRSGFVLAGGNRAFQGNEIPEGVEDGVLTALEISKLNFNNTSLAVLSACQTGLGDIKGYEGVYGLQRAFKMAGVDYLLFSLWEVPDKQTQELMTSFYTNWFNGMEIKEAFKQAQNQLKTKYAKAKGSAFAWAAFVLMN